MPDAKLPEDPSSDELADTRTAWAEDRTVLANERTFAGWMRTDMACVALALGLKAVFKDSDHTLIAKGAAEVFILAAVLIFGPQSTSAGRRRNGWTSTTSKANRKPGCFY
jgi:putative membrane protein